MVAESWNVSNQIRSACTGSAYSKCSISIADIHLLFSELWRKTEIFPVVKISTCRVKSCRYCCNSTFIAYSAIFIVNDFSSSSQVFKIFKTCLAYSLIGYSRHLSRLDVYEFLCTVNVSQCN